jgi:hypothetical protein
MGFLRELTLKAAACAPVYGNHACMVAGPELVEMRWVVSLTEATKLVSGMFAPLHAYLARILARDFQGHRRSLP